jgi:hypothetical protein
VAQFSSAAGDQNTSAAKLTAILPAPQHSLSSLHARAPVWLASNSPLPSKTFFWRQARDSIALRVAAVSSTRSCA